MDPLSNPYDQEVSDCSDQQQSLTSVKSVQTRLIKQPTDLKHSSTY